MWRVRRLFSVRQPRLVIATNKNLLCRLHQNKGVDAHKRKKALQGLLQYDSNQNMAAIREGDRFVDLWGRHTKFNTRYQKSESSRNTVACAQAGYHFPVYAVLSGK